MALFRALCVFAWITDFCLTPVHPRPSPPGEGENVPALFEKPATGLVGPPFAKRKMCQGHSFSWGEKARLRASVKTNFHPAAKNQHGCIPSPRRDSIPSGLIFILPRHPV
jgi:hypothetical protein